MYNTTYYIITTSAPYIILQNKTQACAVWRWCVQHIRTVYATNTVLRSYHSSRRRSENEGARSEY